MNIACDVRNPLCGENGAVYVFGPQVLAFAGGVTRDAGECNAAGIDAFFPIVRGVTTLDEAMVPENAKENMVLSVEQLFRLICG